MKRVVLINLICSLIVVMALLFGICFVIVFGEMFDPPANINSDASIGDVPGDDIGGGAGTGDGTDSGYGSDMGDGSLDLTGSITGGGGGSASGADTVYFTIVSDTTGVAYLKMMSYGDYDHAKGAFSPAKAYDKLMDGGLSSYYLASAALGNSGLDTSRASISSKQGYYALPYYSASGGSVTASDIEVSGSALDYDVEYYASSTILGATLPSAYAGYEKEYYQFVKDNYLYVDTETNNYMQSIIKQKGFSASDSDIISKVARYIQNAASYNLEYDTAMDNEKNIPVAFLSKYNEGVCRHYALAATMMFRSLGIPARYTVGFLAETYDGIKTDVTAEMYHAWVEVYVKGIGWMSVEVTGSMTEKTELVITPQATRAVYKQGYELYADNLVDGFTALAKEGYTYKATVSGSIAALGIAHSEIVEFEIYSPTGDLVYKKSTGLGEDKFKITYGKGIVQQYISHLTFNSKGATKTYDGVALETTLSSCSLVSGDINSKLGYSYTITPTGVNDSVGSVAATYTVTVYKDGVDCTDHFWITSGYGKLVINARAIIVSAQSAEQEFNGKVLTCNAIDYNPVLLASGDSISEFIVEGSQKNIGSSSNVLKSVKIINSAGEDVTHNYKITIRDGLLTVLAPKK